MRDQEITPEHQFSLVEDPLLRFLRALRLVPRDGLGPRRRTVFFVLLSFVPIVTWAALTGHLVPHDWADPMLRHLGVFSRALLGFPLFILSEPFADFVIRRMLGNFPNSGLVRDEDRAKFVDVLRSVERLRDSWVAWLIMLGLVALSIVMATQRGGVEDVDALVWSTSLLDLDFGAQWSIYVVRPLFLLMLLVWLWRVVLCWVLFHRIAQLDLRLVPSHPDGAGGLGFLEPFPIAFSAVSLAISAVLCSYAGHHIHAHGAHVADFQPLLISIALGLCALFLAPLGAFSPALRRCRLRARFQYGKLAGRFVQGLHAKWVDGEKLPDDPILDAPEIGPAADVATLYEMGTRMRPVPIGKMSLIAVLVPAVIPMLVVISLEVPLKEIFLKVLGALA